jgi:protein-tyrosine phosphatase
MIDIHSHILPGLDDGAKSLEIAVEMLRIAAEAGTTDIVATPHANQEYRFDPQAVEQRISELRAAAGDSPRIWYGCDFHLTPENIEDAVRAHERYTINHKGYLLVEFSDLHIPKTSQEIFARLMRARIRPVVTHPERNQLLTGRLEQVEGWTTQGVMLQVTAQSYLGRFGKTAKKVADDLTARGMVHFVASDAHDTKWRTTALDEAFRYVSREFGQDAAERLFIENPKAALAGVALAHEPLRIRRRKWFQFW